LAVARHGQPVAEPRAVFEPAIAGQRQIAVDGLAEALAEGSAFEQGAEGLAERGGVRAVVEAGQGRVRARPDGRLAGPKGFDGAPGDGRAGLCDGVLDGSCGERVAAGGERDQAIRVCRQLQREAALGAVAGGPAAAPLSAVISRRAGAPFAPEGTR